MAEQVAHRDLSPSFIVDERADTERKARIQRLESRINRNPNLFHETLQKLGEQATNNLQQPNKSQTDNSVPLRSEANTLIEHFKNRDDIFYEYDDKTEALIADDEQHSKLAEQVHNKTNVQVRTGIMSSTTRVNLEAVDARDAARRNRLSLYIQQVVLSQTQPETSRSDHELPNAG